MQSLICLSSLSGSFFTTYIITDNVSGFLESLRVPCVHSSRPAWLFHVRVWPRADCPLICRNRDLELLCDTQLAARDTLQLTSLWPLSSQVSHFFVYAFLGQGWMFSVMKLLIMSKHVVCAECLHISDII